MTVGPTLLTANAVARGPLSLVGETLTGIVVKSAGIETEDSAATRSIVADIVANESDAVGYTPLTVTVDSVVLRDDNEAWLVFVTVTDGADLSAEDDMGGLWLALGTDDLVGFNVDDTGSGSADYAPTWDDGYAQFSIESVASLTVADVPFDVTGNVPAAALAAALELVLGDPGTFRALADAPAVDPDGQRAVVWDPLLERLAWGSINASSTVGALILVANDSPDPTTLSLPLLAGAPYYFYSGVSLAGMGTPWPYAGLYNGHSVSGEPAAVTLHEHQPQIADRFATRAYIDLTTGTPVESTWFGLREAYVSETTGVDQPIWTRLMEYAGDTSLGDTGVPVGPQGSDIGTDSSGRSNTSGTDVDTVLDDLDAAISGGGGSGDVVGPGSSTAHHLVGFTDTTGALLEDSGVAVSTDGTMAADSDAKIPTEKAVRTYAAPLASPTFTGTVAGITAAMVGATPTTRTLAGLDLSADRSASALRTALSLVPGTDVQAYDADLAAVAALTTDAFGLALLTKTSSAAVRTYLSLVIGTDVQAYHANLAALAGLTLIADRLPYANGSGTLALATFTAAGRALVDDADAAAQRTTLGVVIGTDVQAYRAALVRQGAATQITSSATPTLNIDTSDFLDITALATAITSMTSSLSGTPQNGWRLTVRIKDDGTARAITWGASFEACGTALPTTTVISKRLTVGFIYDSTTSKWGCVAAESEA